MIAVFIILLLSCEINCNLIALPTTKRNSDLNQCLTDIVKKYYENEKSLTFVDFHSNDDGILTALHESINISIISRKPYKKILLMNEGYIITAKDVSNFLFYISFLQNEARWTPSARFVIIIKELFDIEKVFQKLLQLHVSNVIVINGTNEPDIYTYNPFENFACGRYFDRVISYGPCASPHEIDFFPNKLVTGLHNCTINVGIGHMPPFAFHPKLCNMREPELCRGTEQFAFERLGELKGFKINYSYDDFAEEFSEIDDNMTAVGFFSMIQKNKTDGLFGFLMLTSIRSDAFDYIYQHMVYTDEFIYVVKKAGTAAVWHYLYLEFESTTWIVLFLAIVMSTLLLIFILKPKDKIIVFFKIWDSLFLHGFSVNSNISARLFLIVWIWFAFLINAFYQCSLMSLTTHPSRDFQISTEEDIKNAKLRPCLPPALVDYFSSFAELTFERNENYCLHLLSSMEKISKSYEVYTITPAGVYDYNIALFSSEGEELYRIKQPVMKLIYAIFLYKGFPLMTELEKLSLQLRENGLFDKYADIIEYSNKLKNNDNDLHGEFKARMFVPWRFLLGGFTLSTIVFIIEVLKKCVGQKHLNKTYVWIP